MKAVKQEPDERSLVEAAKADPREFALLYDRNFYRLYAYVARRVFSREEAEDVTSEVFHKALANLHKYESRGVPFAAWLFRIAANEISDRRQGRSPEGTDPGPDLPDEAALKAIEQQVSLFELVENLPAEQRRVIVMRFIEQKKIKEIAGELSKTEGAIKQLQFRALQSLRERLEGGRA